MTIFIIPLSEHGEGWDEVTNFATSPLILSVIGEEIHSTRHPHIVNIFNLIQGSIKTMKQ